MNFNFCTHILSIARNKSLLQISGEVDGCVVKTLITFQGTHILGASRGLLCDSSAVLFLFRHVHVLHFHVQHFHVLQFHVLQFHVLHIGPSISCPAISCPAILMVRQFHVQHFQSTHFWLTAA